MKANPRIKLTKEKKAAMIAAIQEYFKTERDEELGELASSILLNFIISELAPEFYNQGVEDAYKFMAQRCEDLFSIQI